MSDKRLRSLERRWLETRSPEDDAACLLQRVRVGDLAQERLELSARCGHLGARMAYGRNLGRAKVGVALGRAFEAGLISGSEGDEFLSLLAIHSLSALASRASPLDRELFLDMAESVRRTEFSEPKLGEVVDRVRRLVRTREHDYVSAVLDMLLYRFQGLDATRLAFGFVDAMQWSEVRNLVLADFAERLLLRGPSSTYPPHADE